MSNLLFKPTGGGSGGSGFGGINYIGNPNAAQTTLGWATYANPASSRPDTGTGGVADITLSRDTNSELINSTSFLVAKDAVNRQGQGVSYDFSIDEAMVDPVQKSLNINFYYKGSANFTYGSIDGVTPSDITVYVYDTTNDILISVFPYVLDGSGYFSGNFQTTSSLTYRLIFHIGTTNASAWDFYFSNVVVTPALDIFIQSDSDWVAYTPTFTGFGTPSSVSFFYRKRGTNAQILWRFAAGTPTGVEARVSLPTGLLTSSIVPTLLSAGTYVNNLPGPSSSSRGGPLLIEPSVGYFTFGLLREASTTVAFAKANGDVITANGTIISGFIDIPIQGWTSGYATPGVSAQNVPVAFRAYKNGGAVTASTTIPTWTTVDYDSVGGFTASSGQYVVKLAGKYDIKFLLQTTSGSPQAQIRLNGNIIAGGVEGNSNNSFISTSYNLNVGDIITFTSSATLTVFSANYTTWASVEKINDPSAFLTIPKVATIKDVKAANTNGGGATSGSFATRTLNTLVDPFGITSLASNQFVLQPGTYKITASVPGYRVDSHIAKLRNITASSDTSLGTTAFNVSASSAAITTSLISEVFSITVATTFEIQHRVQTSKATDGLGLASNLGVSETYTQVEIQKLL